MLELARAEGAERIVVGLPVTLRGERGAQAEETERFVERLRPPPSSRSRASTSASRRSSPAPATPARPRTPSPPRTCSRATCNGRAPDRREAATAVAPRAGRPAHGDARRRPRRLRRAGRDRVRLRGRRRRARDAGRRDHDDCRADNRDGPDLGWHPADRLPRGLHAQGDGGAHRRGQRDRRGEARTSSPGSGPADLPARHASACASSRAASGRRGAASGGLSLPGHLRLHRGHDARGSSSSCSSRRSTATGAG